MHEELENKRLMNLQVEKKEKQELMYELEKNSPQKMKKMAIKSRPSMEVNLQP